MPQQNRWRELVSAMHALRPTNAEAMDGFFNNLLDIIVPCCGPDVLCGAESKRHDGHRRLTAAGGDETRTVAEEQVRNIM
jgi:hypothetical protein